MKRTLLLIVVLVLLSGCKPESERRANVGVQSTPTPVGTEEAVVEEQGVVAQVAVATTEVPISTVIPASATPLPTFTPLPTTEVPWTPTQQVAPSFTPSATPTASATPRPQVTYAVPTATSTVTPLPEWGGGVAYPVQQGQGGCQFPWQVDYPDATLLTSHILNWPQFPCLEPGLWPEFPNVPNSLVPSFAPANGLEYGMAEHLFAGAIPGNASIVVAARGYVLITGDYNFPGYASCTASDGAGCAILLFNVGEESATFVGTLSNVFLVSGRYFNGDTLPVAVSALGSHILYNMTSLVQGVNPGANCSSAFGCTAVEMKFFVLSGNVPLVTGHVFYYSIPQG
jgi:hypothetical protein